MRDLPVRRYVWARGGRRACGARCASVLGKTRRATRTVDIISPPAPTRLSTMLGRPFRAVQGIFLAYTGIIARSHLPDFEGWPVGCLLMMTFKRFLLDQSGATSIEYALIAVGIAVT